MRKMHTYINHLTEPTAENCSATSTYTNEAAMVHWNTQSVHTKTCQYTMTPKCAAKMEAHLL